MTKSLCDDWMVDHGYVDNKIILPKNFKGSWWADKKVKDLKLNSPLTITSDVTCKDAIHLLKKGETWTLFLLLSDLEPILLKQYYILTCYAPTFFLFLYQRDLIWSVSHAFSSLKYHYSIYYHL